MNNGARLDSTGYPLNAAGMVVQDSISDADAEREARAEMVAALAAACDWQSVAALLEPGDDLPPLSDDEHETVSVLLGRLGDGLDLDDHRVYRREAPRKRTCWDDEGPATLVDQPVAVLPEDVDAPSIDDMRRAS